jgi:hypothetical protein
MNAVEIEEAVSRLAEAPFDPEAFPFDFLEAFGNKQTTLKKLKSNSSNQSDLAGGVLQRNHIHLKVCSAGEVAATLTALRDSPATTRYKAKFILATDGQNFEAENLADGETIACEYPDFPDHFGFFLALAGITTVKQIRENAFDIKATSRLNRLYIELLKDNPDWDQAERREDLNHFVARLIFCFFAEDTNIFASPGIFTSTIAQMSDTSNTHEVLSELFRSMCTLPQDRESAKIRSWANVFPYVNGGLFSGGVEVPRFSKISRSYLLHVGNLDWTKINPDIFGSMIQAVADDEERGALGMHYTSVPNILKVLNPLFLDDLRVQLEAAGDNGRKLLNLRQRLARIRVFDPACGSGNFLVIAYKEMRGIEAEINLRRGEGNLRTTIPLTNFRGIELRHFSAEIARLALVIAEYQCNVLYLGQQEARMLFLPLKDDNWITCGNALRLDWLSLCPPTGTGVKVQQEDLDLFSTPLEQPEIEFENEGGETYICGNPPYIGTKYQSKEHKAELSDVFAGSSIKVGNADYVFSWLRKAAPITALSQAGAFSFVTTSSLYEGEQAEILLWLLDEFNLEIEYAHTRFRWSNNAANNAGVTCCIVKISSSRTATERKISDGENVRRVSNIGPYLVEMPRIVVKKKSIPISSVTEMGYGSMSNDGGHFTLSKERYDEAIKQNQRNVDLLRIAVGGAEFIKGIVRRTIYVSPDYQLESVQQQYFSDIFSQVQVYREQSNRAATNRLASVPHLYAEPRHRDGEHIFVPQILSESREYITVGLLGKTMLVIAPHMQMRAVRGSLTDFSLISSRLHLVWIATVCGKLKTDFRYSNTLGWNTFPVPTLTDQNKADLTRCAEDILLAREAHFPATIADLYNPETMPENLRQAHDRNDETLERIYIGRRFKNDTERLEKLFELYTKMTSQTKPASSKKPNSRQITRAKS